MSAETSALALLMARAVAACTRHVDAGGLPFVGVVANADGRAISGFGVNRVAENRDHTAHAEVVAMREAKSRRGVATLAGHALLATGEPCGLCYRYAIDSGIERIYVAVDRDQVARFGFDYRASYPAFSITDAARNHLFLPLPNQRSTEPFDLYLQLHRPGHATARPDAAVPKGTE